MPVYDKGPCGCCECPDCNAGNCTPIRDGSPSANLSVNVPDPLEDAGPCTGAGMCAGFEGDWTVFHGGGPTFFWGAEIGVGGTCNCPAFDAIAFIRIRQECLEVAEDCERCIVTVELEATEFLNGCDTGSVFRYRIFGPIDTTDGPFEVPFFEYVSERAGDQCNPDVYPPSVFINEL